MPPVSSTTRLSKRCDKAYRDHQDFADKDIFQLIKQLSATPTITAQGDSSTLDAQAALRANKEVFFFRLVGLYCLL